MSPTAATSGRISVAAVAAELGVGGGNECRYDMGDGWQHRIVIETPQPLGAEAGVCLFQELVLPAETLARPRTWAARMAMRSF